MNRRAFIGVLGLGTLAPLGAQAQEARPKLPSVGYLSLASADGSGVSAFRQGLRDLGYVEGRTLAFEGRFANADADRLPALAAELLRLNVAVVVAASPPAIRAARDATRTIPIVMITGDDPVKNGYVVSLARPGGNITGVALFAEELLAKQLELLKAVIPTVGRVALLWDPSVQTISDVSKDLQPVARSLGLQLYFAEVRRSAEYKGVFAAAREHAGAILIMGSPRFLHDRQRIVALAAKHRLPAIYLNREAAEAGGLLAYGPNLGDMSRRAAVYVDKILRGSKPADLPVEQPTKFELVINLKTAKALGLTIPPSMRLRADHVIE
jgi:putative ABC transport system substrate-binding protein